MIIGKMKTLVNSFPVYCIYLPNSFTSDFYLNKIKPSWENYGFDLTMIPAISVDDTIIEKQKDKFNVRERTNRREGKRSFYKSEISRFLTHVSIWKKIISSNSTGAFIIEHDCFLSKAVPEKIVNDNINFFVHGASTSFFTGYVKTSTKTCVGYWLRQSMAEDLFDHFSKLREINVNIERYLYSRSIVERSYTPYSFLESSNTLAVELNDVMVGNTVRDER